MYHKIKNESKHSSSRKLESRNNINHQSGKIHHHIPISKEEDNLAESIKEREKANKKRRKNRRKKCSTKMYF